MRYASLPLLAFASGALAQQCSTVHDSRYNTRSQKFVCGRQGELSRPQMSRSFVSPNDDETGCADECFSDPSCLSFSFNIEAGTCQTYSDNVRAQGFQQVANTGDYFYYLQCFVKDGDCGITNGGFDDGAMYGDAESDDYMPWVYITEGTTSGLNASISHADVIDSNATGNATGASPDGGNYLEITNYGNTTSELRQRVTLVNGTRYTASFYYRRGFTNGNSNGTLVLRYAGQVLFSKPISQIADNDQWYEATVNFTSTRDTARFGTRQLQFEVQAARNAANASDVATVDLDGIELTALNGTTI